MPHCACSVSGTNMNDKPHSTISTTFTANNPHLGRTRTAIEELAARAASELGCRPPRVKIRSMRNACYNPVTHCISVSGVLVQRLPANLLVILIAHETGHAAQRTEILRDGLCILSGPVLILLMTLLAAISAALAGFHVLAIVSLAALAIAASCIAERSAYNRWQGAYLAREMEADRFANRFCGHERGSAAMLKHCANLEDGGTLSTEAIVRVAALDSQRKPS